MQNIGYHIEVDGEPVWFANGMKIRSNEKRNIEMQRHTKAFTLIELIVVISIISLLTGIILPSIMRAKELAKGAVTRSFIGQLEGASLRYQQDNQYFPGQDQVQDTSKRIGVGDSFVTGSQFLASCLYRGLDASTGNEPIGTPESNYLQYKESNHVQIGGTGPLAWAFSDAFSDKMPILYYPSRLGNNSIISDAIDSNSTFIFDDNRDLTELYTHKEPHPYPSDRVKFLHEVWDTRFGHSSFPSGPDLTTDRAYNSDTFILISPGLDREYFTPTISKESPYISDDIVNFR